MYPMRCVSDHSVRPGQAGAGSKVSAMTGSTRAERVTRRRAETRQRLVDAAYEVFAETGIRDAPVELICERAGFTRGAFYSNFDSKEQLFLAVFEAQTQERMDLLRTAVNAAVDTAVDQAAMTGPDAVMRVLHETAGVFLRQLAADVTWHLLVTEFRAQALRQPELHAPTYAAENRFHEELTGILVDVLERLEMRLTVDPRLLVITVTALYQRMLEDAVLGELPSGDDNPYLRELLPGLLATVVEPRG